MFPAYKGLETENLANGGDISVVPFRIEKRNSLEVIYNFRMDFSEYYRHCKFNYELASKISIFFGEMVSTAIHLCA